MLTVISICMNDYILCKAFLLFIQFEYIHSDSRFFLKKKLFQADDITVILISKEKFLWVVNYTLELKSFSKLSYNFYGRSI